MKPSLGEEMIRATLWFLLGWWITDPRFKVWLNWADLVGAFVGVMVLLTPKWLRLIRRRRDQIERGEKPKSLWLPVVLSLVLILVFGEVTWILSRMRPSG